MESQSFLDAVFDCQFGLKGRFGWSSCSMDLHPAESSYRLETYMSPKERKYLNDLMKPIFPYGHLKIERIENPFLWGRYVLQYCEMKAVPQSECVREQIMFHATSAENAYSIAKENFDWRLVHRARFGMGVSFTNNIEYAEQWATRTEVYIVAGVLVANSSPGSWYQEIPFDEEDTTTGFTEDTCIKYCDNDFYPYYIVQKDC